MSTYGVQAYKMRYHEALQVANKLTGIYSIIRVLTICSLYNMGFNKFLYLHLYTGETPQVDILIRLLPLMANYMDARMLISKVLGGDKTEMQRLRREMGPELKPRIGCTDGHYTLVYQYHLIYNSF